jgi:hypothetical protein
MQLNWESLWCNKVWRLGREVLKTPHCQVMVRYQKYNDYELAEVVDESLLGRIC